MEGLYRTSRPFEIYHVDNQDIVVNKTHSDPATHEDPIPNTLFLLDIETYRKNNDLTWI